MILMRRVPTLVRLARRDRAESIVITTSIDGTLVPSLGTRTMLPSYVTCATSSALPGRHVIH